MKLNTPAIGCAKRGRSCKDPEPDLGRTNTKQCKNDIPPSFLLKKKNLLAPVVFKKLIRYKM